MRVISPPPPARNEYWLLGAEKFLDNTIVCGPPKLNSTGQHRQIFVCGIKIPWVGRGIKKYLKVSLGDKEN